MYRQAPLNSHKCTFLHCTFIPFFGLKYFIKLNDKLRVFFFFFSHFLSVFYFTLPQIIDCNVHTEQRKWYSWKLQWTLMNERKTQKKNTHTGLCCAKRARMLNAYIDTIDVCSITCTQNELTKFTQQINWFFSHFPFDRYMYFFVCLYFHRFVCSCAKSIVFE